MSKNTILSKKLDERLLKMCQDLNSRVRDLEESNKLENESREKYAKEIYKDVIQMKAHFDNFITDFTERINYLEYLILTDEEDEVDEDIDKGITDLTDLYNEGKKKIEAKK